MSAVPIHRNNKTFHIKTNFDLGHKHMQGTLKLQKTRISYLRLNLRQANKEGTEPRMTTNRLNLQFLNHQKALQSRVNDLNTFVGAVSMKSYRKKEKEREGRKTFI